MLNFLINPRFKFYLSFAVITALLFPYYQFGAYPDQFKLYYHLLLSHTAVGIFIIWGGRYTMILGTIIAFQRAFELVAVQVWGGVFFKGITAHVFKMATQNSNDEVLAFLKLLYPQIILGTLFILFYLFVYFYCCRYAVKYLENKRQQKQWWKNTIRLTLAVLILSFGWKQKVRMDIFFWETNIDRKLELYASKNTYDYLSKKINPKIDVYVIVGESASKSQMSLYGYKRKTTPYLDSIKNKAFFTYYKDPVSAGTNTEESLAIMFSRGYHTDYEMFFLSPNLIEELNHAGYNTVWVTHKKMNKLLVYPAITNSANEFYNSENAYDDREMLPYLKKSFNEKPTFYFIHMNGSHLEYGAGLNDSQRKWSKSKTGDKKQDNINAYDDTILALDDFIKSVHKIAEEQSIKNNRKYTIIYFSDHGQNLYHQPDTDWLTHSGSYESHPNGMRIPFLFINKHNLPCKGKFPNVDTKEMRLNDFFFFTLKSICAIQ